MWDSAQEGAGDTIHIDYDGEYGSERVCLELFDGWWIASGMIVLLELPPFVRAWRSRRVAFAILRADRRFS